MNGGQVLDLLRIRNLHVHFQSSEGLVKAVDGVDLDVGGGETLGLLGETGSGKTVLGLAVIGLLPRNISLMGEVWFRDKNLLAATEAEMRTVRGRHIAMILQNPLSSLNPALTVGEQIAEAIRAHQGAGRREAWAKAEGVLEQTGIPAGRARQYPHQFSGGMRQRAMIALGLACRPSLLIADEPTKGLDVSVQIQIVELIKSLTCRAKPPRSMLIITHDLGVAAELADRVAIMYAGKIVETGSARNVFKKPAHPYTRGLLASHPGNGLRAIRGHSPSLLDLPPGCSFHPRCERARPLCLREEPPEKVMGKKHRVRCHYA